MTEEGTVGIIRKDVIRPSKPKRKVRRSSGWMRPEVTEETRQKLSAAKIGRKLTEEHKNNIRKGIQEYHKFR